MPRRQHFKMGTWLDPEEYAYPSGTLSQSRRKFKAMMNAGVAGKDYVTGVAGIPDTYFTIPARGTYDGMRVKGYIHVGGHLGTGEGVLIFNVDKHDDGVQENPAGGAKMPQAFRYEDAKELLRGRSSRNLGANTEIIEHDNGVITVRLYATDIIAFDRDGLITLNNGGHATTTTIGRMNAFLSPRIHVFRRKGTMYAQTHTGKVFPFRGNVVHIGPNDLERTHSNPFMERQVFQNDGWVIETDDGDFASPDFNAPDVDMYREAIGTNRKVSIGDRYGRVTGVTYLPKKTWWGRLSAPGYMDATEYVYGRSRREVERQLSDMYGDDDDDSGE